MLSFQRTTATDHPQWFWPVRQDRYPQTGATTGAPKRHRAENDRRVPRSQESAKVEPAMIVMNASGRYVRTNKLTWGKNRRGTECDHFRHRTTRAARDALTVSTGGMGLQRGRCQASLKDRRWTVSAFSKDGITRVPCVVRTEEADLEGTVDVRGAGLEGI